VGNIFFDLVEKILVKVVVFLFFGIVYKLIQRLFRPSFIVEFPAQKEIAEIGIILVGENN